MCVVIDMNVWASVFNKDDAKHLYFTPVKDWIINGKAKIVAGGSTYFSELEKLEKYRRIFINLRKAGKVYIEKDSVKIDELEQKLSAEHQHRDFDDPHIVALLIITGCPVICSNDERAFPYFQKREWYPKGQHLPKIYCERSYERRDDILNDENLPDKLKPHIKLNKKAIAAIGL